MINNVSFKGVVVEISSVHSFPYSLIRSREAKTELKTLEWWISGFMLDPLFLIISRLT